MPFPFSYRGSIEVITGISQDLYVEKLSQKLTDKGAHNLKQQGNQVTFKDTRISLRFFQPLKGITSASFSVSLSPGGLTVDYELRYTFMAIWFSLFILTFLAVFLFALDDSFWEPGEQEKFIWLTMILSSIGYAINVVPSYLYIKKVIRNIQ